MGLFSLSNVQEYRAAHQGIDGGVCHDGSLGLPLTVSGFGGIFRYAPISHSISSYHPNYSERPKEGMPNFF